MGQLVLLQPGTFRNQLLHSVIDDSRARKVLGYARNCGHQEFSTDFLLTRYRPQWETAQTIRYSVDEVESGKVEKMHALQLNRSSRVA